MEVFVPKQVQVLLDGSPSFQHVNHTAQLNVSKFAEGTLDPTIHVTDKDATPLEFIFFTILSEDLELCYGQKGR